MERKRNIPQKNRPRTDVPELNNCLQNKEDAKEIISAISAGACSRSKGIILCCSFLVALLVMVLLCCVPTKAITLAEGVCGTYTTWSLDEDGTLWICGIGEMDNYCSTADIPWYPYSSNIKAVVIEEGITRVGNLAFYKCRYLKNVTIPDSVTVIGDRAFSDCYSLDGIMIPMNIKTICDNAFDSCPSLTEIFYEDSQEQWDTLSIGENACLEKAVHHYKVEKAILKGDTYLHCPACDGSYLSSGEVITQHPIGDFNWDDCVSNEDALCLLWYILFPEDYSIATYTDFTNDGRVNNSDVVYLLWHILYPDDYLLLKTDEVFVDDVPENSGVKNALLNFEQLVQIDYTALKDIPHRYNSLDTGNHTGVPYSSTRPEGLFVPNNVSFHTFMTALQNPNSYLYTVDLGELGNENGNTYYGAVCSTACAYALGIVPNYSTHQWKDIPGMEIIENQSAYGLKLGDTITGKGHVVMVTGITRNARGKIGHITISEASNPKVHSTRYTPDELEAKYPPSSYTYCRYSELYAVEYESTPYVAVGDEVVQNVTYNTAIIPRKGDKANWLVGQDVVIDVLEPGNYSAIEIYKDGTFWNKKEITSVLTLKDLDFGSYKARLTNGEDASDWCYWIVVDAASSAVACGADGKAKITFAASNAVPLYVQWANGSNNGTVHISELTEEEIAAGVSVCRHTAGYFKIRVAFQTEYGIIFSELPEAITVK